MLYQTYNDYFDWKRLFATYRDSLRDPLALLLDDLISVALKKKDNGERDKRICLATDVERENYSSHDWLMYTNSLFLTIAYKVRPLNLEGEEVISAPGPNEMIFLGMKLQGMQI